MSSADLVAVADQVYAEPVHAFTAARDAVAKGCADKALAASIKALKKPSLAAWAINLLVRRESEQIDQVLALAESLRAAAESLDGDELRTLTRQRRQLTAALSATATELAREYDVRLTGPVADQVEGILTAAMIDPVAAEVVRSGLVLTAFTSTGLSELDISGICAVPDALGHRAEALPAPSTAPPVLHVVPDDTLRVAAAQERLDEAVHELAAATEELEHRRATAQRLQARRLQLHGEIDECRRRLAALEDDVEALDEEIGEAATADTEAAAAETAARAALTAAQKELDRLTAR